MSYTPTEFDNIERSPKGEAGGGITSPPASEGMTPEEFARHKKVLMGINSAFGFVLVIMWFAGVGLSSFLSYFIIALSIGCSVGYRYMYMPTMLSIVN